MFTERIHVSYETKPIYASREQYTEFVNMNQWQKIIGTTLYCNGSGIRICKTLMVRERAVGVVLYCIVLYF